jgi:hypothetical protein
MESYIANFCFERSKDKTEDRNCLVLYAISERGSFGPLYIVRPEFRYASRNSYTQERANELIKMFKSQFAGQHTASTELDSDENQFRIHFVGADELSKFIESRYKYKFYRQPQTEYFRTMFEGQHNKLIFSEQIEECLVSQKDINKQIRQFYTDYIFPLRQIDRQYAMTHNDAFVWQKLNKKSKQALLEKIVRNKEKIQAVNSLYSEFKSQQVSDTDLKHKLSKILDASKTTKNVSERVYRVFNTPEELLETDKDSFYAIKQIEAKTAELDKKIKKVAEKNSCVLDIEDLVARLFVESGVVI